MDELIGRQRAHHHQARLRLACRFAPLGSHATPGTPGDLAAALGQVSLYTHPTLPWRYFNHAVVQDWDALQRCDLAREVVRRMLDAGRPACFEMETPLDEKPSPRTLLQRLVGQSPAAGPRSGAWVRELTSLGFVRAGDLNVLIRRTAGLDTDAIEGAAAAASGPVLGQGERYIVRAQSRQEMESSLQKHSRLHRAGFGTPAAEPGSQDEQLLRINLGAGVQYFWAIEEGTGEPAGSAAVLAAGGLAELFALSVLPAHRRQGLGARLALAAVSWAAGAGCDLVYLETEKGSRALSLYLRLGFEPLWRQVAFMLT